MKKTHPALLRSIFETIPRQVLKRGFTLIEIMAAIAVLGILGLMIVQIINTTARTTRISNSAVDAASQARLVLERIGLDLNALIRRDDVDFRTWNPPVSEPSVENRNALFFLSGVASAAAGLTPTDNRGISLVAYQVGPHADNGGRRCLIRAGMAIPWQRPPSWGTAHFMGLKADGLPVLLESGDSSFPSALIPAAGDYDILAPGVVRMVIGFQLYPDNQSVSLLDGGTVANARGQIVYSPPVKSLSPTTGGGPPVDYVDLNRIASIVVGLVALDLENLRLLDSNDVNALASHFGDLSDNDLPVSAWKDEMDSAISTSIPRPAAQAVRVFQRFYPITPYGGKSL